MVCGQDTAIRVMRLVLIAACVLVVAPWSAGAEAEPKLYLFWQLGCPHCERALGFLHGLEQRRPRFRLQALEISQDPVAADSYAKVVQRFGLTTPLVPLIVVGDRLLVGFRDEATSGRAIEEALSFCLAGTCPDLVGGLLPTQAEKRDTRPTVTASIPHTVWLPLIGAVRTADLSLPAWTIVVAAVDGFNPCAMWALVFLIGLLLGLRDRRRMWLLGTTFLGASAMVYFLILTAWLNLFMLLGAVFWVRLALGAGAVAGGCYYLHEYARSGAEVCPVTAPARRRRVLERLRALAGEQRLALALAGIVLLAFAVTLVDLLCSVGLPAVYTEVLTRSNLPLWQYYALLLLYVVVFMADDAVVLATAMATLRLTRGSARYARLSHLLGGILLITIGAMLILRPSWLTFG